jgi:hypothetical protein
MARDEADAAPFRGCLGRGRRPEPLYQLFPR